MAKQSKNNKSSYNRSLFKELEDGYEFTTAYHTMGSSKPKKTAWKITDAEAHKLFRKAYLREISHCRDGLIGSVENKDYCWMNDNLDGLCSFSSSVDPNNNWPILQPIGHNGELFAFFPKVRNSTDTWHGYPENGGIIQKGLLKYWLNRGFISDRDYKLIRTHRI